MSPRWTAWLILPLAVLTGCSPRYHYVYTPPDSAEGRLCVNQCLNSQQQCETLNQNAYQQCQNNRNWAMQSYNQCLAYAPNKKARKNCSYPPTCSSPSSGQCETNYRSCYQSCGGRVDTLVEPD